MSKKLKYLVGLLILILLAASWPGFRLYQELNKRWSEDPTVWGRSSDINLAGDR